MCTIVGFKKVVSKKDSTLYVELHVLSDDRQVEGQIAYSVFVRGDQIDTLSSLAVGAPCDIFYNRFGRAERVLIL